MNNSLRQVIVGFCLALWSAPAVAQAVTPWNDHPNSKVRLLAGEGRLLGIELQMAPGWKTYWRMPGDAGVPPSFDWAASQNVAAAEVLYPAPETMTDSSGTAIGYKGTVIFPVQIKPITEGKPIKVVLEFAFGVCKDICIPVESKLTLDVATGQPWPTLPSLQAHRKRVPEIVTGAPKPGQLITSIAQQQVNGKAALVVTAPNAVDVYVEAPDGLYVPLAVKKLGAFTVDLAASPDLKDLIGKPLRITAVTTTGGSETSFVLH